MGEREASLQPIDDIVRTRRQDKKAQGGKITFSLARGIGNAFVARNVPDQDVIEFLQEDLKRK